jgi:hypothetical protein
MTELQQLIAAAGERLLTKKEEARMTLLFWLKNKPASQLGPAVRKAYAIHKKIEAIGGTPNDYGTMNKLRTELGSGDFGVLFAAAKMADEMK